MNDKAMTADILLLHRAGEDTRRSPNGIATAPFWMESLVRSDRDGGLTAVRAMLDPGTITHWHTHPDGQVLYALSGVGLAQRRGGAIEELRAGDCVLFLPEEVHWHGAAPGSSFSYISVQGVRNGRTAEWLEPVERDLPRQEADELPS
jgi:quercetin dioxygenase-like cupin family protein